MDARRFGIRQGAQNPDGEGCLHSEVGTEMSDLPIRIIAMSKKGPDKLRVVLLLGAGATLSDVATRPLKERPPLDHGFFKVAKVGSPSLTKSVGSYMERVYQYDIIDPATDSLERVMGQIYTDTFNPGLKGDATRAFRALLQLFTRRIADTTNDIRPTRQRWLYRIVAGFLAGGVAPENLTVITYNQDLQVEKTLWLLSQRRRWAKYSSQRFNFPTFYELGPRPLTSPRRGLPEREGSEASRVAELVFDAYQFETESKSDVQSEAQVEHYYEAGDSGGHDDHGEKINLRAAGCGSTGHA